MSLTFASTPIGYNRKSTMAVPFNTWTHVAGVYDQNDPVGEKIILYVNGVRQPTSYSGAPAGTLNTNDNPLQIGRYRAGKPWIFNGVIDEVATFSRALTQEEIEWQYQNGLNGQGYELPSVPQLSCVGFEPPMDKTLRDKKKNRVLPLKMICYDGDTEVTDQDITPPVVEVDFVDSNGIPGAVEEVLYSGQGDEGNQFVYSDGYWRFNLKTKNFSAYGTYTIEAKSGDTNSYNIEIPNPVATFVIE